MRFGLAAILIATAIGGCITVPQGEDLLGPRAFVATYDLAFVQAEFERGPQLLEDRPSEYIGRMKLQLKPPVVIADDTGELRTAYVLESVQALWPVGSTAESLDDLVPTRHYLDGDGLLMRSDRPCRALQPCDHERYVDWERREVPVHDCPECCEPAERCGDFVDVSWAVKGSPAPFGYGWQETMRVHQAGQWQEVALVKQGGTLRLPPGWRLPLAYDLDPNLAVQLDGHGIPERFVQEGYGTSGRDPANGPIWTKAAQRTSLELGEALDPIAAWPLRDATPVPASDLYFAGDTDEAFTMGVTFRDMLDELLARAPAAKERFDRLCAMRVMAYFGGGYRYTEVLDPLGSGDEVAVHAFLATSDAMEGWEIRYSASGGLISIIETPGYSAPESGGKGQATDFAFRCDASPGAVLTPNQAMQDIWIVDLLAGYPCLLEVRPTLWLEAGRSGTVLAGLQMGAWLFSDSGDDPNDPMGLRFTDANVFYDAVSGRWSHWSALAEDLSRFDAGTMGERALPREALDAQVGTRFHCIEPQYDEGPLPDAMAGALRPVA
ncbi:MAG: hypothetical protein WC876_01450 [Candidatus Thermoplasmatota archaeon]